MYSLDCHLSLIVGRHTWELYEYWAVTVKQRPPTKCLYDRLHGVYSYRAFVVVESSAIPSHCEGVNERLDGSGTFRACHIAMRRCDIVSEAVDDLYR